MKEIVEAGGAALDANTPKVDVREAAKELAWISAVESTNHWPPRKMLSFWAEEAIMGTSLEIRHTMKALLQTVELSQKNKCAQPTRLHTT